MAAPRGSTAAAAAWPPRRPRHARGVGAGLRRLLVGLLVLALLSYGHQAFVRSLLGPLHRHVQAHTVERPAWMGHIAHLLQELRTWRDQRLPMQLGALHGQGQAAARHIDDDHRHDHHHDHHEPERHHHAAGHASPVLLDAPLAEALSKAAAGSAGLLWLTPRPAWRVAAPPGVRTAWPLAPAAGWRDAPGRLPERPPRA